MSDPLTVVVRTAPGRFAWTPSSTTLTPRGFVQGGAVVGAAILAMEEATGRTSRWAHAQFAASVAGVDVIDIDVDVVSSGRQLSQARATCGRGDVELLTVQAGLGSGHVELRGAWGVSPSVAAPFDCPPFEVFPAGNGDLGDLLELRLGYRSRAQLSLWVRRPEGVVPSHADLAVIADIAPLVFAGALEAPVYGVSLDNVIRFCAEPTSEWTLLDIEAVAVGDGIGIARARLWNEAQVLVADANQSAVIRSGP